MSDFVLDDNTINTLIKESLEARKNSYCPYSGYAVGAALLTSFGKIYKGCNIENSSYGATNCAERTALFSAVSNGEREFSAIAITGAPKDHLPTDYAYPCGICRQVLSEFCDKDFKVIVAISTDDYKLFTLNDLLPASFGAENMI